MWKAYNFAKYIWESYQSRLFHLILKGLYVLVNSIEVENIFKKKKKNYRKN